MFRWSDPLGIAPHIPSIKKIEDAVLPSGWFGRNRPPKSSPRKGSAPAVPDGLKSGDTFRDAHGVLWGVQ